MQHKQDQQPKIERLKLKMNRQPVVVTPLEVVKAAMPFFGGTTPASTVPATTTTPEPTPPATTPSTTPESSTPSPNLNPDPIEKLSKDPNALGQLLAQVDKLQKDLTKVTGERDQFVSKQQEDARRQQTREQQLESDLAQRDAVIQQMDGVIRNMAIGNAVLSQKEFQWHSVKQVLAELNSESFEIDVDLERGSATVTGIESEVKRIARDCPWLVAKAATSEPITTGPKTPRSSGAPPAPPNTDVQKQQRRSDLMKRFPVIAHGR